MYLPSFLLYYSDMKSLAYIPGSDGSGDASLMTITQVRTAPATSITVNTTAGVPAKFFGTMGTPHTFSDPVTGETITVISEATAVNFAGHIDSGKIEIDAIADGETDLGSKVGDIIVIRPTTQWANNLHDVLAESHNDDGSLKDDIVTTAKVKDKAIAAPKIDLATLQLGYSQVTSSFSTSNSTATIIPGTSITFNIPSSGVYFISMGVSTILGPHYTSVQARMGSTILARLSRGTVEGGESPNQYSKVRVTGTPGASVTLSLYLEGSGTGSKTAAAASDRPLFIMASVI